MDTKQLLEAVETIRIVKAIFDSPPNPWLPVIAAIGGAFVGSISSVIPNLLLEARKQRNERKSISNALIAEIRAMLTIVRHRQYLAHFEKALSAMQNDPASRIAFSIRVPDHYSRVFQANVSRLGLIPEQLAAQIIEFHQLIDSIVQDVTASGEIAEGRSSIEGFEQLLFLAKSAVQLGEEIVNKYGLKT